MKKTLFFLFLLLPISVTAQKVADFNKAVVNLITYNQEGDVLHSAYGYVASADGEIIAPYHAFKGAVRAEVVDVLGRRSDVLRILGASSLYDLVRASTNMPTKKLVYLSSRTTPAGSGQGEIWQTYYTNNKKEKPQPSAIVVADTFDRYMYYTISTPNEDRFMGCPIVDSEGKVVGLVQRNITKDAVTACAIDIRTADSLVITSAAVFNSDLSDIKMPKRVPTTSEEEAFSYIYLVLRSAADSTLKQTAVADFMEAYPDNHDIYGEMAAYHAIRNNFPAAETYLQKGIERGGELVSDLYFLQSELMFAKVERMGTDHHPSWNLEAALSAAEKAYSLKSSPRYLFQQGIVLFGLKRFKEAYDKFTAVNNSPIANRQSFLYAATALENDKGDTTEVIALLDSAINHCAMPYTQEVLVPLFNRAKLLASIGEHRKAVADLIEYEKAAGANTLNAYFYFLRSGIEKEGRMFQQALDDLTTAVSLSKTSEDRETYMIEKALLYLQVRYLDEALSTAREVLDLNPNNSDAHKIIGVVWGEKKQKAKAIEHLGRAQQLGDENATQLISKYR